MANRLDDVFYNVKNDGFLGTPKRVRRQLTNSGKKHFTTKKVSEWISEQDVTTLHKQHISRIGRNHYLVNAIDSLWELDLCNMVSFAGENSGFKHILTVIDVFSKYAFAKPVKNKTAIEIFKTFKSIITESGRKPKAIQSDLGLEFKNNLFKKYCYANNIKQHYPQTQSLHKCAVIERFNRSLKQLLFKYFTMKGRNFRRYIDVLPDIVNFYNNSMHRTIKMKPNQVRPKHTVQIYHNIKAAHQHSKAAQENNFLIVNDFVRVIKKKKPLEHAYTEKWSREIFQINQVINARPYTLYKLKDLRGRDISGKFYYDQLQKIKIAKNRPIKIIKSRGLGAALEHYIETADKKQRWISHKEYEKARI